MNKINKHLVFAAVAFMLSMALFAGLGNTAQAAPEAPTAQTWYCDPGTANRGIQFTLDNLASPGDTICLWPSATSTNAGVYFYENVVVNYSVTILGLNHGKVAFDPRNPESYVFPKAAGTDAVFTVLADNVTIDGVFVAASGTFGATVVDAEHGILVDQADAETTYVSDVHLLNNFVESAAIGIEFEGDWVYSDGNVVEGNYVLRYFAEPDTLTGIEATGNMFVTIENNKVKNYEDAIWIEGFDLPGTINVLDNIVQNTNFELCHGIWVEDLWNDGSDVDEELILNIDGNFVTGFVGILYDTTGIGIFEVQDYGFVHISITDNVISAVEVGMNFLCLDIDLDYPVILDGNIISMVDHDAVQIWNNDGDDDWVAFQVSYMSIMDVADDAFEVFTDDDGTGEIYLDLIAGVNIEDAWIGFDIEGQGTFVTSPAPEFSNNMDDIGGWYFDLDVNTVDIDATRIALDGMLGREMNFLQLFDVENMTWHAVDQLYEDPTVFPLVLDPLGFVMYVDGAAYVSQENQIQYAIEVCEHDDLATWPFDHTLTAEIIFVQWGEYDGVDAPLQLNGVYIWRPVILTGTTSEWGSTVGEVPVLYYDTLSFVDPGFIILIEDTELVLVNNFVLIGDGCGGLPADAIRVRANGIAVHEIVLHDIYLEEFNGMGISMTGFGYAFLNILIDNVDMDDLALQGIYLQVTNAAGEVDENVLINNGIAIMDCDIEDVLETPIAFFGAAIELWGIQDVYVEDNYIMETNEGIFDESIWYLGLIVTSTDVDVINNTFDTLVSGEPQNGVYLETDKAGDFAYALFDAATPLINFNEFWLYEADDAYAIYYYEGDGGDATVEIVDARYNFWWDNVAPGSDGDLGPYSDPDHDINPNEDGMGCQVEDYIYFAPWYMDSEFTYLTVDVFISENKNEDREYVDGVDDVFYTIQDAVDAADNFDWVVVNPGAYFEQVEIVSNISLLGAYIERFVFEMALMEGSDFDDYEIICIDAWEWDVSATVDNFEFVGAMSYLIDVYGSTAVISNNLFWGSETGMSDDGIWGQIAVLIRENGTASIFGNEFYQIAQDEDQEMGAVSVESGSSAAIYTNYFEGNLGLTETAIWAEDVIAPLFIMDNHIHGFWFGVDIACSGGIFDETSTGVAIAGNMIDECLIGISMDDIENSIIEENTIIGEEELPIWYGLDFSFDIMINEAGENVVVVNNNLLSEGNGDDTIGLWNAYSEGDGWENVIADDNFWGKASGPGGAFEQELIPFWTLGSYFGWNDAYDNAWGAGTIVSDNVTYTTWLNMLFPIGSSISAEFDAPIFVEDGMDPYVSDTGMAVVDAEGDGWIALASYIGSPGMMFWGYNLGIYVEIAVWNESEDLDSLTVLIDISDAVIPVGVDVNDLRLFFWDADEYAWFPCIASNVDAEDMFIEMTFDVDSLPTIDMLRNDMAFMIGAPKLIITPTEGKSGIIIEGFGSGFMPGQTIAMYIGKTLMGAIPNEIEGVYIVDEDGNVTGVELILPYLNQGEYQITMTDPEWLMMFQEEYFASADYLVLGNQMYVQLDVGAMYFAGEIATWYGSANTDGLPYMLTADMIIAYLMYNGEVMPVPADNIEMVSPFDFMVTMPILGDAAAGQYTLKVFVFADDMYAGTNEQGFQISQTFEDMTYALIGIEDGIMTLSNQMDTLQLSVDEIGAIVVDIQGDVVSIQTTLGLVKTTVDRIDVNVISVQGNLVTMQAALSNQIGAGFAAVQSTLASIEAKVESIQGDIVTLSSTVGAIQLTVADIDAKVTLVNNNVVTLTTNVGIVQTTLNDIGAIVETIDGNVATLQTSVGDIQISIDELDAKIVALSGNVATISTNLNTLTTTVNAIGLKVTAIDGRTVTMSSTLGNITGTLTAMTGSLATINTNLGQVKTDVGNIAGATTGINSTLAFIILAILIVVAIVLVFLRTKK